MKNLFPSQCECSGAFIWVGHISENLDRLSNNLTVDESKKGTFISIDEAGKMFLYLNSCPLDICHYNEIIRGGYPKTLSEITLIILNLWKNSDSARTKMVANKVLGKIAIMSGYQYIQPEETEIQKYSYWNKNISNVKGIWEAVKHI